MSRKPIKPPSAEARESTTLTPRTPGSQSIADSVVSESSNIALTTSHLSDSGNEGLSLRSSFQVWAGWVGWFLLDQWFLIALGILILISSQVQVPASEQETKKTVVTYLAVAVIFFITGCTLQTSVLVKNYSKWKLHLFVQVQCFLMTSATTFGVVSVCATNPNFMDPWLLIGLIFMGCVPTTISSNVVMTKQANGNQALTVVESTIGNFLGPFLAPVLLSMYTSTGAWYTKVLPADSGTYGEIYRRVFKQLGLSLFLPMFVGQGVQNIFPKATRKVFTDWKLSKLGSLALLIVVWQSYDQAFETGAFDRVKGDNIVFIVFISVALWALWLGVCVSVSIWWLPKADTIAVAYCVPAKTPAMGVPLSTVIYLGVSKIDESKLQIPMVVFQGLQIAAGSLLTVVFRWWIREEGGKSKGSSEEDDGREPKAESEESTI